MPCWETICINFLKRSASSSKFFIQSLQVSDALHKSSFFFNYLTILHQGDHLQLLLVHCFGVRASSVLVVCRPMGAIWWGTRPPCPLFQVGGHNMRCPPTFSLQVLYLEKFQKQK